MSRPPPPSVLEAFRLRGEPQPLRGGQGRAWRVDDFVLKPNDMAREEIEWRHELFERLGGDGFRVARPRRTATGAATFQQWTAEEWVPGEHRERRWPEVIVAGDRFHAALRREPRPAFLDRREDPWATGDRVAWDELDADTFRHVPHVAELAELRHPVDAPSQLVHGDLTGNVLFHETHPPAVIDFSPYWRPVTFASGIVVADALVWEGADSSLLSAVSGVVDFGQYLVRALMYRAVTHELLFPGAITGGSTADVFAPAIELAISFLR